MQENLTIRQRLYKVIFEHDTPAERAFDLALILTILLSVVAVMLDSVAWISQRSGPWLVSLEWGFTALFTLEYILRLYSSPRPLRYAFSFYGLIDLLAILPSYLSLLFPGSRFLLTIRVVRVLRIFRVLKLVQFVGEANVLAQALRRSRHKISVFILTVLSAVIVVGSLMYLIEGPAAGFTSIPTSIYWAIVTLTTVGYGDIAPKTALGQALAALLMITGYGIIAVPTGIVTVELGRASAPAPRLTLCPECGRGGHEADAAHCKHCGARLEPG
ncbi:MAG TPA: ion transporter [Thermoanaerobaculia bacterium]|nr:ion transporter [Thermoanaerobaculia bacterium]